MTAAAAAAVAASVSAPAVTPTAAAAVASSSSSMPPPLLMVHTLAGPPTGGLTAPQVGVATEAVPTNVPHALLNTGTERAAQPAAGIDAALSGTIKGNRKRRNIKIAAVIPVPITNTENSLLSCSAHTLKRMTEGRKLILCAGCLVLAMSTASNHSRRSRRMSMRRRR